MFTLISLIFVVIGALNWLLVGALEFNLVTWIFGTTIWARIIYIIIGLMAFWLIYVMSFRRDVINYKNDLPKRKM